MFAEVESADVAVAFGELHAGRARLNSLPLHTLTDADLLTVLREQEADARRSAVTSHAVIAELEARGTAREHGCPSTATLLVQVLRINPNDASGRVRDAADLGPRRGLTGEVLPPIFAQVAAAQADGVISAAHARVITKTITTLPEAIRAEHEDLFEESLVEQAHTVNPFQLAQVAQAMAYLLDQDGTLVEEHERHRRRALRIQRRTDGSAHLEGELTALSTEALLAALEPLAAPAPAGEDGAKDPRSYGQRLHDALYDAALIALRSQQLPDCGGVAATIVLHLTPEQIQSGTGLVTTGHGAQISVPEALTLFGDARIFPVLLGNSGEILAYGSTRRIFTEGQRLAMIARDLGCSFPGCTRPPALCQSHHITGYAITRRTTVADGTLCSVASTTANTRTSAGPAR